MHEFLYNTLNFIDSSFIRLYGEAIIKSALLLFIGWWAINKICKIMVIFVQKANVDAGMVSFLDSLLKFSLRIILLVMVLSCLGLNVTSILAAVGATMVALGIALKDSLSNLVSGVFLVINKPIHIGDYIEFEGFKGTVVKIEMFFTVLQADEDNKTVIIPNSRLVSNNIVRKSEFNLSPINFSLVTSRFENHNEFSARIEKNMILNSKIFRVPPPEIKIQAKGDKDTEIKIFAWCQGQYFNDASKFIETAAQKTAQKFNLEIRI